MEWKSLKEFPNYQFSDTGLVKKGGEFVKIQLSSRYPRVTLQNDFESKRVTIHRVVAELFIGPCPAGQIVRHLDDNRENNNISNLAYGTDYDNKQDAVRNGKIKKGDEHHSRLNPEKMARGERHGSRTHPEKLPRGENHPLSKLTQKDVDEIRSTEFRYGVIKMLAEKFNVGTKAISRARKGITYNQDGRDVR